jgi:hypothetical protein
MDEAFHRRWINSKRFGWHEAVLRDPDIQQSAVALALAGHVMHRYSADKGFAQFSIASAAKALNLSQRQLKRARKRLKTRGWIRPFDDPNGSVLGGWRANRYLLGGGPEDLLFDAADGGPGVTDG